jgi:hypothetical protein
MLLRAVNAARHDSSSERGKPDAHPVGASNYPAVRETLAVAGAMHRLRMVLVARLPPRHRSSPGPEAGPPGPRLCRAAPATCRARLAGSAGVWQPQLTEPLPQYVDAVTVPVPDLDRGLTFYRDVPGHQLIWRSEAAGQAWPRTPGSGTEIVQT